MLGLLLPLLTKLPGLVGGFFKDKNDLHKIREKTKLAKEATRLAEQQARKDIAMKTIEAELERGSQQIKATSKTFKHITFFLFMSPFMLAMIAPQYSTELFARLGLLPHWYVETVMVLMFAVWGISVSKDVISNIFRNLGTFMLRRQQNKLNLKLPVGTLLPSSESNPVSNEEWMKKNG